jgi:hypothetical protein
MQFAADKRTGMFFPVVNKKFTIKSQQATALTIHLNEH